MKFTGKNDEYFEVLEIDCENCAILEIAQKSALSLLWFQEDENELIIDTEKYTFHKHEAIFLTEFHKIEIVKIQSLKLLRFNKDFYCILNHDNEVSCKGILYYGASKVPLIQPSESELEILETVWKMLQIELTTNDNLQLEMLQMMLKRIIILCTRIYKRQANFDKITVAAVDIVREFNYLVEQHFKEKHTVKEYAQLLYKSPKTLSNIFKKKGSKSPLQFIQNRIMLEAKRMIRNTDLQISEISEALGFSDIQTFSRFFKKQAQISPIDFRNAA